MQVTEVFSNNVRNFIKLHGLKKSPHDSQYQHEIRWLHDEFDAFDFIDAAAHLATKAGNLVGSKKRANSEYDYVEDVMLDVEELMVASEDQKEQALKRRKNLSTFHLVVIPFVEGLRQFESYEEAMQHLSEYVALCKEQFVALSPNRITFEDGLIAKTIISNMIQERENARKLSRKKPRKVAKRRKREEVDIDEDADVDLISELTM